MSKPELDARYTINLESYQKIIQIEARIIGDLALNHIIPTALSYQTQLLNNVEKLQKVLKGFTTNSQVTTIKEIGERVDFIHAKVNELVESRKRVNEIENIEEKAKAYCDSIIPFFDKIRNETDKLEKIIDDKLWPLPKYRELLFAR